MKSRYPSNFLTNISLNSQCDNYVGHSGSFVYGGSSAYMTEFKSCAVLVALLLLLQRFTVFVMTVAL